MAIEEFDNLHEFGRRLHLFVNVVKIGDEGLWNQKVRSKDARRTPPHVRKHLGHLVGIEGPSVNHAQTSSLRDCGCQLGPGYTANSGLLYWYFAASQIGESCFEHLTNKFTILLVRN